MLPLEDELARNQVMEIDAKVLSNRKPPYPIHGGLYDALKETDGHIFHASNAKAREAAQLFQELEGIDIHPAAAVATASLIEQVKLKAIDPQSVVMLNITGGGEKRFKSEYALHYLKPQLVFDIDADIEEVKNRLQEVYLKMEHG
jgi:cysteate synthase